MLASLLAILGSAASLCAFFPRSVALPQLHFALLAVASLQGDSHLHERAHAERAKRGRPQAPFNCLPQLLGHALGVT